jgi:hypothetical protein
MTKHIISEKLKTNLSSIASIPESNVTTTLDDAYHTKISGGQNTSIKMNDSFSDIAAKILNLISLNKADRKHQSKLIESDLDGIPQEKYSKIEDSGSDSIETKTDELNTENIILGYESWRLYRYWKMLKSGDTLTKLVSWFSRIGKKIFDFKWIKDIATYGLDIIKGALKLSEVALKFVPGAGTMARIGVGVGVGVGGVIGMSKLIASGESGKDNYNAANRGLVEAADSTPEKRKYTTKIRKYSGNENFSGMTIGEISRRQHLPRSDPDYIHAVGKYQMIRGTMDDAIRLGFAKKSDIFDAKKQEYLFSEYLIKAKRPEIVKYLNASPDDPGILNGKLLDGALAGLSKEFASVEYKPGSGVSFSNQKASISAEQASAELLAMRNETQGVESSKSTQVQAQPENVEKLTGTELNEKSKNRSYVVNNGTKVFIQPIIQQTNTQTEGANYSTPTSDHRPNMLDND